MQIELDKDEANVLSNLLDVAVKAVGLQGAEAALHFVRKIQDAQKAAEKEEPAEDINDYVDTQ